MCIPVYSLWQDLSHGTVIFDLSILTLKFDILLKNFDIGCYLVMVAARRALLSSDNSYLEVALLDASGKVSDTSFKK